MRTWIPVLLGLVVLLLLLIAVFLRTPDLRPQGAPEPVAKTIVAPVAQVMPAGLPEKAEAGPLPNFDFREAPQNRAAWTESGPMKAAAEELLQRIPGLVIDRDPVTGTPKWVASNEVWLTAPAGGAGPEAAERLTRDFLEQNRDLFGHGPELLDEAREVTNYTHDRSTSRKVIWHQQYLGIEVFEAILQANFTESGELMNIGSQFVPRPKAAGETDGDPVGATLPVEKAVAIAGQSVGERVTADSIRPTTPPTGAERRQQFRAALITDADARLAWLPRGPDSMVLTWDVTLTSPSRAEMYRILIDAKSGEMLLRQSLTAYNEASFRVYTTESPTPMSPGHEFPSSLQPAAAVRTLETLSSLNPVASPIGWVNAGGNITSGNNADAYTDTDSNNTADLPRTTGSPNRVFDFPLNATQEPVNFKDASVTQLFYWTNFMHDRMYSLGFTEPAGNFQVDNFGRGGLGADPVNAEAQDGSGTNNANFSTPIDGGRGRMQMYNWTSATPDRDGSFEAEVVLHEYGHGVSNRLVGGPSVSISSLSTRGMGEGWSDFYGLALTAEAEDDPHGNWARGAWSRYLTSGWLSENYYYGARRYSYSTDMRKNPLTLKDIDPTQIDLHPAVQRNPTYSSMQDATQVHYQGTVWCVTLWEMRANLILKHGFAIGNERSLFLVTEGMKLGPANPNFIQARDGILQATSANHPGDRGEVWSAFAKRGMGDAATAPASTTTTGIVETYTVPDSLEIVDRDGWNITGNLGGPFSPATRTLSLHNDGFAPLTWIAGSLDDWITLLPSSGSIAPGATVSIVATGAAEDLKAGFHSTNVVFTNTATGFNQPLGVRLYVTPVVFQSFDLSENPGWTTTGQWAFGVPTGSGGTTGGSGNDPTSGATGANVYGVNLSGAVSTAVGDPFYLTSSPIDLSTVEETRLRFKRWLNTNSRSNTLATVEISVDGVNWREVFANPGLPIRDFSWQTVEYDLSTVADRQPSVSVRWSYRNLTSSSAYSGWNIDDVEILGQGSGSLTLDLAGSAAENAGPIDGVVNLDPAQAEAVVVNLVSTDPGSATVTPTVTFAPGEVVQNFTVTLIDNEVLDGTRTALIRASSPSTNAVTRSLEVTDNESASITLSVPASVSEGAIGMTGSVGISAAPTRAVVVTLSSTHAAVEVPASLLIPSGSTGPVSFPLVIPDNALVDGSRITSVTASVPGWAPGNAQVTVTDNDVPLITLTGSTGAREGDGSASFVVTVNTIQGSPRVLSLSSSDTSELIVPASVTIPAGQFSANFSAVVVDDALADGAQTATISVSGATFANATRAFTVADNEISHYTFSPVPVIQIRNRAFTLFVTARDVNGAVITNHSGSLTLTSNSSGGPVPFSPAILSTFDEGIGSLSVSFSATGAGVALTAADIGGVIGTSNSFEITAGPVLVIDPGSLSLTLNEDSAPGTVDLALANPGSAATAWDVVSVLPSGEVREATLSEALANLNEKFAAITNLIPNRYQFTDGVTGTNIPDGGLDMYDNGNYLSSNLAGSFNYLAYSDNTLVTSTFLGQGGRYFTRKHPGLFVFGADVAGLSFFEITGNLGADGSGSTDLAVLTATRGSRVYKGFVKRVYGAGDPSVNHLVIIEDNGTATQTASTDTNNDLHRVNGLGGVTRLYYLLYAGSSGGYINNSATQSIMEAFIDSVRGEGWLTAAPESGTLNPGQQAVVTATIDPQGLPSGNYFAALRFRSNDLTQSSQDVPVSLTVRPGIDYFDWAEIPSPQQKDVPIPATLSARDSGGALVDSFYGTVSLSARGALSDTVSGTGTTSSSYPLDGGFSKNRLQSIYTPAEVGQAGQMEGLAFHVAAVPGALSNFTIRLKHTLKANYSGTGNAVWEGEGWATVFSGLLNVPATGWMQIPFIEYFPYDGTSNLMVDISFDNGTATVVSGSVRATTVASVRSLHVRTSSSSGGAPSSWTGATPSPVTSSLLTNLTFSLREVVPCLPQEVTLSGGVWTGDLRISESAPQVSMNARFSPRPGIAGDSNGFGVNSLGPLTMAAPGGGNEGEILNATVSVADPAAADRTVNLTSSDTTEATVPASVVIAAGETSAAFDITLPDDGVLDMGQTATITAAAEFYDSVSATVNVVDVATTTLTLSLPGSVTEGTSAPGTVTLTGTLGVDIVVSLLSSGSLLGVPAQVTIASGQNSAIFSAVGTQNSFIEAVPGNEVTVTATLAGYAPVERTVTVIDNESRQIILNLPVTAISEGAAPPLSTSRVLLGGLVRSPLTVALLSGDPTEVTVPASVTVPAGASQSEVLTVTPVNDTEFDGSQIVTITAAAPGFLNGSRNITILDDDVHHFTLSAIPGPNYKQIPFPVTITARDVDGSVIPHYAGSPVLSGRDGSDVLPVTPAVVGGFINGVRTAAFTVADTAAGAILTLTDPLTGASAQSNVFVVLSAQPVGFTWSAIPSPQVASTPFPVTLAAVDDLGEVVTDFTGAVAIKGLTPEPDRAIGAGTVIDSTILNTAREGARSQSVYLASEMGPARVLTGLSLNMSAPPSMAMSRFTIRLRHTTRTSFVTGNAFENPSLSTVYATATEPAGTTGWRRFRFDSPFSYNGTSNLLVDIAFDNAGSGTAGLVLSTTVSPSRKLHAFQNRSAGFGDPLLWINAANLTSTSLPNVLWHTDLDNPLAPATAGPFAGGIWSGSVSLLNGGGGVKLLATNDTISGLSNPFDVQFFAPAPVLTTEPPFTGGLSNAIFWTNSGESGAEVRVERSTSPAFTTPVQSAWTTATQSTFASLLNGTTYHYRAQRRLPGGEPAAETWSQASLTDFQGNTLTSIDLTSNPGSVGIRRISGVSATENFESTTANWADTIFSQRSAGTYTTESSPVPAPLTTPFLPVSADPDREGVMISGSIFDETYALQAPGVENEISDGSVTAYIYPRNTRILDQGGVLIRGSGFGSTLNGYLSRFLYNSSSGSPIWIGVSKVTNGFQSTIITSFGSSSFDPATEQVKIQLSAVGTTITARLWKVAVSAGVVTETLLGTRSVTDTSHSTGVCGIYAAGNMVYDDVVITPIAPTSATMLSPVISPTSLARWGNLTYNRVVPPGTTVTVDVLNSAGTLLASNVASGANLGAIPALASQTSIRLRANLTKTSENLVPLLQDWSVHYHPVRPLLYSEWSNVVSSIQDTVAPQIGVASSFRYAVSDGVGVTGTASDALSGIASVAAGSIEAVTADQYANWTLPIANLAAGANHITITASDNAVPPNTASVITTIYLIVDPNGDSNNNGISSLLEFAFGIPASLTRPEVAMPKTTQSVTPATGEPFFTMEYRRRLVRSGILYTVETSTDLEDWGTATATVQELSAIPTGDGVTEKVTVRVTSPEFNGSTRGFIRLKVRLE